MLLFFYLIIIKLDYNFHNIMWNHRGGNWSRVARTCCLCEHNMLLCHWNTFGSLSYFLHEMGHAGINQSFFSHLVNILFFTFNIFILIFVLIYLYIYIFYFQGMWYGMLLGTTIQTSVLIWITARTDWDKEVTFYNNNI